MSIFRSASPEDSSKLKMVSPPSSQSEQMEYSSQQLTPRSKVKAMLAAIDTSSDEETDLPATHCARKNNALTGEPESQSKAPSGLVEALEDRYDGKLREGGAAEIVPQGSLAKKLHARALDDQSSRDMESLTPDDAYARIRQQLANVHAKGGPPLSRQMNRASPDTASSSSDAIARFSKPKKARIRSKGTTADTPPQRSPTPVSSLTKASANESPISHARTRILSDADSEADEFRRAELQNSRFHELVARKRAEREAKQAEAERKQAAKGQSEQILVSDGHDVSASSSASEDDVGHKFTQSARPTRKASKKALEEMTRETQRMNRNMQLAHQARTKKRISKDSLFARLNFRSSLPVQAAPAAAPLASSTVGSSAPVSDAEPTLEGNSPFTNPSTPAKKSPMRDLEQISNHSPAIMAHPMKLDYNDLPEMASVFEQGRSQKDKDREADPPSPPPASRRDIEKAKFRRLRIPLAKDAASNHIIDLDSDSEAEDFASRQTHTSGRKRSKLDAFKRLPTGKMQEARSLLTLRALAHLNGPNDSRNGRKAMLSIGDMQTSLRKRARQQALEERKAKIEDLKARGILIQSAEEREQDQAEVEDMLEKARREAQELMQKEKRAAKNSDSVDDKAIHMDDTSDDDDEDYRDNEAEDADIELSGSEEEHQKEESPEADSEVSESDDDISDAQELEKQISGSGPSDDEATENLGDRITAPGDNTIDVDNKADEDVGQPQHRRPRRRIVDFEEEEEEDKREEEVAEHGIQGDSNETILEAGQLQAPTFPLMLGASGPSASMFGLTQAFAATMADECELDEQDSIATLGPPPEPDLPTDYAGPSDQIIIDSQHCTAPDTGASHYVDLRFSQSQVRDVSNTEAQSQRPATQLSEIPEPTQDAGFMLSSPAPERFGSLPPSTVDTVLLPPKDLGGPSINKKRGRLYRRNDDQTGSDHEGLLPPAHPVRANAFDLMAETRKGATNHEAFNKKKSEAKEMIEEQAQESEDDYAGMGGASDDESGGELDEHVEAMIDHGEVDVDERALAALHANKERASDEKAVEKLFKDINSGGLRRKRGNDFDLSDSDDDREARRRRKQREFAKMRKALLADEKVGQIAEDPKKLAFLRAIEDHGDDEDLDFLDRPAQDSFYVELDTQEDSQTLQVPATQDEGGKDRRNPPLQEIDPNMRPPAVARRTAASNKKPSTLLEIRDSVSFLTELPGAMCVSEPSSSADEAEDSAPIDGHSHPRRTASNPIVDRLLLKRQSSSSMQSSSSRLAFYDPSATSNDGFKIPSLLRRATTNLSLDGAPDKNGISTYATTERAAGGGEQGDFVRKGGSKKSSVNYFAREQERLAAVKVIEKRRQQDREKRAKERRSGGLVRLVSAGGFD